MNIERIKTDLQVAIQQAEHKPGEWAQTAQSMGGICCPGEPFQIGKPWPQEQPWANFSYKRDSWLAVAAVNAVPALLAEIDRLEGRKRLCPLHGHEECLQCMWPPRERSENDRLKAENERLRGLLEEIEALRPDALRYRWLRDLAGSQDLRYPLTGKPDEIDATVDAGMTGPVYRCHACNSTTPPPEPYRAYVTCACGEKTAATAAQAGHPDAGVFAWLYVKESNGAVQLSRTKQHAPGNWVENDGYSINPLYEGPEVPGVTPDAWAFRTLRDEPGRDWKLSVIYPLTACEPGHLEVKALYKQKPVAAGMPA